MTAPAFIAVDWGTTNRRAYAIDDQGAVLATTRDDRGITSVARDVFPGEIAALRARFGDVPVLCAGMIGSTRGWVDVPYRACPAGLADLAAALHWVETGRTAIIPGLSIDGDHGPDVMRGEEVQLLGAVRAGMAPADALLCQPGTHCKWARMDNGEVAGFRTTITGELFALLKSHSLLGDFLQGDVAADAAFHDGLLLAAAGTLLTSLFGERAAVVRGRRDQACVAARVSGLLVGTDVREQKLTPGEPVHILADAALGGLYAAAVAAVGGAPELHDSQAAFVAGINAIWEMIDER